MKSATTLKTAKETFTNEQVKDAIRQWLRWGEDAYKAGHQQGYFSGDGWGARCLKFHLRRLSKRRA